MDWSKSVVEKPYLNAYSRKARHVATNLDHDRTEWGLDSVVALVAVHQGPGGDYLIFVSLEVGHLRSPICAVASRVDH